jgi:hypothetical protein
MNRTLYTGLLCGILLFNFSGCSNVKKVNVNYNRAPLRQDLKSKRLLIGKFENGCKIFDASRDFEATIAKLIKEDEYFTGVKVIDKSDMPFPQNKTVQQFLEEISDFDWIDWNTDHNTDLLLFGTVYYDTQDFSGYDSQWRENKYGYRVPEKIWKEKLRYEAKFRIVLVEIPTSEVILDKEYRDEDIVEGAADEVGVYLELADENARKFIDQIRGVKVKTRRYLLVK